MFRLKSSFSIFMVLFLSACGGGGDVVGGTDGSTGVVDSGTSSATYFPLQVFMQGSNYVPADVFDGVWFDPLIHGYIVAPVNGSTLLPLANPNVNDFKFTINGAKVDSLENGLMMQRIVGLQTNLNTAIIIDTSGSSQPIDKSALIQEVKRFISVAKSSSDPVIRNQRFTLWAYGTQINVLVGTLTDSQATLDTALDNLLTNWNARGEGSSVYGAIYVAIGSYADNSNLESGASLAADAFDDLVDEYTFNDDLGTGNRNRLDGVNLSTVVVFASGANTNGDFQLTDAQAAVEWQSIVVYDDEAEQENSEGEDNSENSAVQEGTKLVPRPVIYVSLGANDPDSDIQSLSSYVIDTNSISNFSGVAEQIISSQQSAIELRTRPDNQYLIRYAMFERYGDHETVFASNTNTRNYTLTTKIEGLNGSIPATTPQVEIAGPNNAYLAGGRVSLSDVTRLYPTTRWTNIPYTSANYSWSGGGTVNSDGSLTISSADIGNTITLTNTALTSSVSIVVTQ